MTRTGAVIADPADYATYYPSLTGTYSNPAWVTSLAASKLTRNIALSLLAQTSAVIGDTLRWNGSSYAPATIASGGTSPLLIERISDTQIRIGNNCTVTIPCMIVVGAKPYSKTAGFTATIAGAAQDLHRCRQLRTLTLFSSSNDPFTNVRGW